MGTLRNSIQDNTATKNGQNYLDATESNKTNYNNAVDSANGVINATSNQIWMLMQLTKSLHK